MRYRAEYERTDAPQDQPLKLQPNSKATRHGWEEKPAYSRQGVSKDYKGMVRERLANNRFSKSSPFKSQAQPEVRKSPPVPEWGGEAEANPKKRKYSTQVSLSSHKSRARRVSKLV
jgi:hypothetical protein